MHEQISTYLNHGSDIQPLFNNLESHLFEVGFLHNNLLQVVLRKTTNDKKFMTRDECLVLYIQRLLYKGAKEGKVDMRLHIEQPHILAQRSLYQLQVMYALEVAVPKQNVTPTFVVTCWMWVFSWHAKNILFVWLFYEFDVSWQATSGY